MFRQKFYEFVIILLILTITSPACGPGRGREEKTVASAPTNPSIEVETPTETYTEVAITPTNIPEPSSPQTPTATLTPIPAPTLTPTPLLPTVEMVDIPAGTFIMGNDNTDADESPTHEVDLPAFQIDKFEVTNANFALFVEATSYLTDRERENIETTGYQTFAEYLEQGGSTVLTPIVPGKEQDKPGLTWQDS